MLMSWKSNTSLLVKSLLPGKYRQLAKLSTKDAVRHFFGTMLVGLILFSILLIPGILVTTQSLTDQIAGADSFNISVQIAQEKPIMLLESPVVQIDTNASTDAPGLLVFTRHAAIWHGLLGQEQSYAYADYQDLSQDAGALRSALRVLLFILIPFLVVLAFVYIGVLAMVLSLLFGLIAWAILRPTSYRFGWAKAFRTSLFASTAMVLVEWVTLPFVRLFWMPLAVFLVYAILGTWMALEREFAIKAPEKSRKHKF